MSLVRFMNRTTDAGGRARQKVAFAAHIAWAKRHDLALPTLTALIREEYGR